MYDTTSLIRRSAAILLALLISAPAHADCSKAGAAWITLELTSPLAAGDEAMEFVEVTRGGCITTRYASYHVAAGIYQRELDANELRSLRQTLEQSGVRDFDAKRVAAEIRVVEQAKAKAAGVGERHFLVADGEIVRIAIDDGGKRAPTLIRYEAPKQRAKAHASVVELRELVRFIEHVQLLGADPGKREIAEVTP